MTRKMTMIKKTLMMVMMVLGVGTTWGQTDYSGTYYIKSESVNKYPSGDYYLCPTENWAFFHATNIVNNTNNGQPFLTTHIMDNGEEGKYKWIIEKHTVDDHDYYAFKYSIDYVDGESSSSRYLSYNGKITISGTGTDRMRIHLKKIENPTDDELFDITPYSTYWVISPKKVDVDDSNKQKYLVVNGGNTNDFKAYYDKVMEGSGVLEKKNGPTNFVLTTGILGTWNNIDDPNAPFSLEEVIDRPTFASTNNTQIVINHSAGENATIYYTTDGSSPTTTNNDGSGTAPLQIDMPANAVTLKAIAVIDNLPSCISSIQVLPNATVSVETSTITYNGSAQEPVVTVKDGETPIPSGEYEVGYSNNVNASDAAVVMVTNASGGNYIVYGSTTFTINKKDLTVTANPKTITYGDEPVNDGVEYSGFITGESATSEGVLSGTLTYTYNTVANGTGTAYTATSDQGSYYIIPSGLSATNYAITFVPGTLTVDQKEVGLTWSETTSFPYDGNSHGLTATAIGLVNSDEIGVTVSGAQTNAGNHTATASELTGTKAGNYKLPVNNTQVFTITQVGLTVTANDNTITYGEAPAGNGVTYEGFVNNETESKLDGSLDYEYSYSQYGDVGNAYTITPKGLTSNNYDINFASGTLTVNPKTLTITADAKSKNYGDADPTLTYTSEGLVNGDAITGVLLREEGEDIGTYAIHQNTVTAGNNYIITFIGDNLTINKRNLTITADSDTKVYDGTALTKDSYTTTELAAGDQIKSVTITGSQTNVGTSNNVPSAAVIKKGETDVTANYNITYTNGTLEVTKKTLTITADAKSKNYGEADPELTYTSEGLIIGDAITGTLTRAVGEEVGIYAITQGSLTAGNNYTISFTGANLIISKAKLTITAKPKTITYGDDPANDGVTYSGLADTDDESVLSGSLTYAYNTVANGTGAAYTKTSEPGSYYIIPSGLSAANYVITFAPGTLTVNPKEVGLTWSETTSFTYDGEEHAPTATATGMVNGDEIGVTVTGAQTNAQTNVEEEDYYKATASALTGDKAGNYKLPATNTQSFTITPKSLVDGTTLADGYILNFGENNTILLTDDVIGSALVLSTDYSVGEDTDPSEGYAIRTVTGINNYTGSFTVRNAFVTFSTDTERDSWSATFVAEKKDDEDIGFVLPEGFSAFIISDIRGEWAIPEPLNYIPADVPVLLVANHQTQGFVVTEASSSEVTITPEQKDKNMLEKVTEDTPGYNATTESVPFETKKIYLLYKNEFVFNKAGNLKKGKVFLNPNHIASSPEPAPARLQIAWNYTTGIELIDNSQLTIDNSVDYWYTLDGRQLQGKPTTKGLYINNGNKVVIK